MVAEPARRAAGLYQFLPARLSHLARQATVVHRGKELRSAFIIDLAHGLLLRRHLTGREVLPVSSQLLKSAYGREYASYLGYLVDAGMVRLESDYFAGVRCRMYRLDRRFLDEPTTRHVNNDPRLVRRAAERRHDLNPRNGINQILKLKLVANLRRARVDHVAALDYLSRVVDDESRRWNAYPVESVRDGHLFWHFDDYGRFHSNFTIMKGHVRRNHLTIDGEPVIEVDIPNSQPLFLARLMAAEGPLDQERRQFAEAALSGRLYRDISAGMGGTRDQVKKAVYRVLFGQNRQDAANRAFRKSFPSVHDFVVEYKARRGDYRSLAYDLQRAESDFVYNSVLLAATAERGDLGFLTVHDSVMVRRSDGAFLRALFDRCLAEAFGGIGFNI